MDRVERANELNNRMYGRNQYGSYLKKEMRFFDFVLKKIDEGLTDEEIMNILIIES